MCMYLLIILYVCEFIPGTLFYHPSQRYYIFCFSIFLLWRPPLPACITENFKRVVPKSIFTSNPCRILYCTKEIVIFREDIFTKMCRNSIYFSSESSKAPTHVSFGSFYLLMLSCIYVFMYLYNIIENILKYVVIVMYLLNGKHE